MLHAALLSPSSPGKRNRIRAVLVAVYHSTGIHPRNVIIMIHSNQR